MPETVRTHTGLTGNQLKILAMIAMTCDHVGLQLLPRLAFLRWIGRLALPIYAYLVAEGCRHTRDRKRYLLRMASLGALCQIVYYVAMGSLYQCILVTFSLSIFLICCLEEWKKGKYWLFPAALAGTFVLCVVVPDLWKGTDFAIDYGFAGAMLPVLIYAHPIWGLVLGLTALCLGTGGMQWLSLGAIPLLLCYNGQRGKAKLGRLFYWYYPVHLAVIYGLSLL